MSTNLVNLLELFAGLRVLVVGDVMLDSYLEGSADRLCREAPVPVVTLAQRHDVPGGAANAAANVASLGGDVALLSVIGDDVEGDLLRQALRGRGIGCEHLLVCPQRTTLAKHRIMAATQILVRLDQGSTEAVDAITERALLDRLNPLFLASDVVIISDYGYGVLTPTIIDQLASLQARAPRVIVVDSKDLPAYRAVGVTAVKPNYAEALRLIGESAPSERSRIDLVLAHGEHLLERLGTQIAAITLDTDGALLFERGSPPYRTYAQPRLHSQAAGAGDTFVSALALALAAGADTSAAAELASAAAAVVVQHEGTVVCDLHELRDKLLGNTRVVADLDALRPRLERYRADGRRIVFANGCFDLLHRGHVSLLNSAKALGDLLIVGVNSDSSIGRLKGAGRPINTLEDRMQVLAALSCIDHLIAFDDDTPHALVAAIRPDVFVKGGNYQRTDIAEADLVEQLGGSVQILPYLEQRSTSRLIERIAATHSRARTVAV